MKFKQREYHKLSNKATLILPTFARQSLVRLWSISLVIALISASVVPAVPVNAESATPVYEWTAYLEPLAGIGPDVTDIATAPDGSVYMVGDLIGTIDFNPDGAGDVRSKASGFDVFITKRGNDGSYQWTRVIGDPIESSYTSFFPNKIAMTDAAGNIYVWGEFRGSVNFDPTGSDVRTSLSSNDDFITKWNADGSYGWTHTFGTAVPFPSYDSITSIEVSATGDAYIAGDFSGPLDFNAYGAGDIKNTVGGGTDRDAYITKINADGSYGWTQTFGGTADDYVGVNNLLLLGDGSGILAPVTFVSLSIDADPGAGITTINQVGCCDMIALVKLDTAGNLVWALPFGNDSYIDIDHMTSDSSGAIYAQGEFGGTLDFDPGPGTELVTSVGSSGAYVLKWDPDGSHNWSSQYIGVIENNGIRLGSDGVYGSITYRNGSDWTIDGTVVPDVGSWDSLVAKWDFDGNFQWYRSLGSDEYDYGYDFAVNATCDSVYTLGEIYPASTTTINFNQLGSDDRLIPDTGAIYLTRYAHTGEYTWTNIVDTAVDYFFVDHTAIGPNDSVYYAGEIEGTAIDFDDTGGSDIVNTGGVGTAVFVSKLSNTNYRQHLLNLGTTIDAVESGSGDNAKLGGIGVARTNSTTIQIEDASSKIAVAQVTADLSCDRDWSGVDAESDDTAGEAFVAGLTAAEGTDASIDLYVPVLSDSTGVGVCPGATTLLEVDETCTGMYQLASGDPGLTTTTIGEQDYWAVLGVTDGGAYNVLGATTTTPTTDPPTTSPTTSEEETSLADTGLSVVHYIVFGSCVLVVAYIIARQPRIKRYRIGMGKY